MNRAYTTLQVRAVDDEQRVIEGIASTDALDDYGTILEPKGARYTLPLPLLWQHRSDMPVGEVFEAKVSSKQITIKARFARIDEPGALQDEIERAWQAVKYGLVKGLSVGFKPEEVAPRDDYDQPVRFVKWLLRELSLVTLPANEEATIQAVRSADLAYLARASSGGSAPRLGAGAHTPSTRRPMTTRERIQQHEATRAARAARQVALMDAAEAAGTTLDQAQAEEYDTLRDEIRAIDEHLVRLNELERDELASARPVAGQGSAAASQSRGVDPAAAPHRGGMPVVRVQQRGENPGLGFARYVMSLVACQGNRHEAAEYARATWGEQGEGVALLHRSAHERAAVAAGTTTNATFAAPLVQTNYIAEFLELLRPQTLIGKIANLRRVPFNVQMTVQTAGGTYNWVGQGVAKPVTNMQVAAVSLGLAKAAGIIVISEELARSSTPAAQEVVQAEMIAGMQQFLDTQLVDPAITAVANVSPASITNGVAGTAASGTAEANIRQDLRTLIGSFGTNNLDLGGLVILMGETLAFKVGSVVNSLGQRSFPNLGIKGGEVMGVPVVTSNVTPLLNRMVAVHGPSVMLADDGGTEISISREASIIMDSAPSAVVQAAGAAPTHTSLWQNNLVGIRAERWINWGKARSTAVDMITGIAYV
jgi:HK97 family phage prohead protease/HK97 family phage major capsid protein